MSLPFSQLGEGVTAPGDGEIILTQNAASHEKKSPKAPSDNNIVLCQIEGGIADDSGHKSHSPKTPNRPALFNEEQRTVLLRYFDEYGLTSTHRRYTELLAKCASEVGTSLDRVKNWIGSESVKRKRKVGILPRPKIDMSGTTPVLKPPDSSPAAKKPKRVNGYNVFFSSYTKSNPSLTSDLKERNVLMGQKWAELSGEERKMWALKAESLTEGLDSAPPSSRHTSSPEGSQSGQTSTLSDMTSSALIETTLMKIQEKFDLLQQVGFEGYAILINTNELQSHLIATTKGKNFHRTRQKQGKPLENPFIGYVFSDDGGDDAQAPPTAPVRPQAPASLETLQQSLAGAFALKFKLASGKTDVPYDSLQLSGYHVVGMPVGVPLLDPLLYSEQQLHQVLANLDKIIFLRIVSSSRDISDLPASLLSGPDVEISASH